MSTEPAACLLTIPCELRNAIYQYVFSPGAEDPLPSYYTPTDPIAVALKLQREDNDLRRQLCRQHQLRFLQTCKQVHHEAYLLALSLTAFHVTGENGHPECFESRTAHISDGKLRAIRHITLTARISHLRALNEAWAGWPFGNSSLDLDTLTIVPIKPNTAYTSYAEVADLSQSHTLAYVFAETFKQLRNVRVVQVKNSGCFNETVWRIVYRSIVYRMWRWGGERCGVRFECSADEEDNGKEWFKVWLKEGGEGSEVGDEVVRLVGGSGEPMPDPNLAGF